MAIAYAVDWSEALAALRTEVSRVVALLRSVDDTQGHAVGDWDLGGVAMHLSQAWIAVPALARRDLSPVFEVLPDRAGANGESLIADVWDLGEMTTEAVGEDAERNPQVLADRIEERAAGFFRECEGRKADERQPWMVAGTTVDLCTLTCHLLNETVVHGADIARGAGRPWPADRRHAALVIQGFFLPVIAQLDARSLVDQERAAGVRATYEVRLRGAGRAHFVFDDGALTVAEPTGRRVDCYILADPVAMLDVMWGRQSQWPAIATGKLLAWGRKPWLGPKLRLMMRNP
ncbi:MAG: SCP2 sterol-binding domain-containing protein [Acidimicrobiales bacterium]